jgi:hypothetical protein
MSDTQNDVAFKRRQELHEEFVAYIDATGGLTDLGNAHDNILYHALVIPLKPWELRDQSADSFPVTELITAKQDALAISSWLMQYKHEALERKQTWQLFDRIVTDYSMVYIIAVNQAFNDLSVTKYLDLT